MGSDPNGRAALERLHGIIAEGGTACFRAGAEATGARLELHNAAFTQYAAGPGGDRAVLDGAKALAMTAIDVLVDEELRRAMRDGFAAGT